MLTIRIKTDDYLQQKFIFDLSSLLTFFMNTLCIRRVIDAQRVTLVTGI